VEEEARGESERRIYHQGSNDKEETSFHSECEDVAFKGAGEANKVRPMHEPMYYKITEGGFEQESSRRDPSALLLLGT